MLIGRVLEQMRQWKGQHPTFQVHPMGAELPPGFRIARRHSYITVQWEV